MGVVVVKDNIVMIFFLSSCQTRDDFLGQVDVPLNQIPVSFVTFCFIISVTYVRSLDILRFCLKCLTHLTCYSDQSLATRPS